MSSTRTRVEKAMKLIREGWTNAVIRKEIGYPDATINLLRKEIEHAERRQRERQRHQG